MPHKGACLCGQVTIELASTHKDQVLCHCTDCKQSSGSAFSTNILAPKKEVTITGPVKEFDMKAPSGNTVTRVFCSNCGSAITHLTPAFGEAQAIQTGNFSDFAQVPINVELFVKDRWTGIPAIAGAAQFQGMPTA
ncbi:Mss4-like protein [Mycena epipterygia]|nr:Mss4-like protein [Mycena epipterygia]